jgi:hypothetical protein
MTPIQIIMRITTVEKCRQSPGECGCCGTKIKTGEAYRWWKFRYSGKFVRCFNPKCAPKPSQLISNPFQSALATIGEDIAGAIGEARNQVDPTIAISAVRDAAELLRDLGSEQQEKLDNMPEGLQQGDTGQLLENRANECEDKACTIESAADQAEIDWENRGEEEDKGEQEIADEICDALDSEVSDISID